MRCPKCGYISFDHIETCLKCKKEITGSTEAVGTTYQAASPSFLQVPEGYGSADESTSSSEIEFAGPEEGFDFSDPDLDVLVDEDQEFEFEDSDDTEDVIDFEEADLGEAGNDFQLEADEDIGVDDGFNFDLDLEDDGETQDTSVSLNVPDELEDISDLAPPAQRQAGLGDNMSLSLDDEVSMDEDLDLDGLDLDLGLGGDSDDTDSGLSLSLDDIDFSTEDDSDMDGMIMDLDLGGFDESPAPKREKSSGSLDDLSLSLD
jgi:hypothetical protein